ncbi:hypothetical protein [Actinomadura xylanilytica]|uniref:hypothetical protein n=1 Tax=Actinomadura xylanilytica TaxID=887459 RepID=UPI00255A9AD5|nr:hypothetical protein [Actinomadura xylanilytica]MDL4775198.1 hypothetical protein [Actinomadura xylanilytica]
MDPASDAREPEGERQGRGFVIALLSAFAVTGLFALSSYFWVNWGTPDERTLYSTVSLALAGALLGMLVQAAAPLDGRSTIALVLVLSAVFTSGGLGIAYWKNHQPVDVTDKITLDSGRVITKSNGEGFTISTPVPKADHKTLRLKLTGKSDTGNTGDCLFVSRWYVSGSKSGSNYKFNESAMVPIGQAYGTTVKLNAILVTDQGCKIKIGVGSGVIDS